MLVVSKSASNRAGRDICELLQPHFSTTKEFVCDLKLAILTKTFSQGTKCNQALVIEELVAGDSNLGKSNGKTCHCLSQQYSKCKELVVIAKKSQIVSILDAIASPKCTDCNSKKEMHLV